MGPLLEVLIGGLLTTVDGDLAIFKRIRPLFLHGNTVGTTMDVEREGLETGEASPWALTPAADSVQLEGTYYKGSTLGSRNYARHLKEAIPAVASGSKSLETAAENIYTAINGQSEMCEKFFKTENGSTIRYTRASAIQLIKDRIEGGRISPGDDDIVLPDGIGRKYEWLKAQILIAEATLAQRAREKSLLTGETITVTMANMPNTSKAEILASQVVTLTKNEGISVRSFDVNHYRVMDESRFVEYVAEVILKETNLKTEKSQQTLAEHVGNHYEMGLVTICCHYESTSDTWKNKLWVRYLFRALLVATLLAQLVIPYALLVDTVYRYVDSKKTWCPADAKGIEKTVAIAIGAIYAVRSCQDYILSTGVSVFYSSFKTSARATMTIDRFLHYAYKNFVFLLNLSILSVEVDARNMVINALFLQYILNLDCGVKELFLKGFPFDVEKFTNECITEGANQKISFVNAGIEWLHRFFLFGIFFISVFLPICKPNFDEQ